MSSVLTDARALVTGAGHGIGQAIAIALAEAGADVAVHYGSYPDFCFSAKPYLDEPFVPAVPGATANTYVANEKYCGPGSVRGRDLADVVGQPLARRAAEICAAGGHHLLLLGPPGVGKTMLAERLPTVMPRLEPDAALEVTAIPIT